jgi:NDMA-dependent alcohol dehydrogenase
VKTRAAVLWGLHQKWEIEELDLDGPKEGEVLVKLTASGLCHSDDHLVTGDMPMNLPVVGGHEGAGVVADVGPGVTEVEVGDHVVLSFIPACGRCRACAKGMGNLCEYGAAIMAGPQLDGTFRFHGRGHDIGQMCVLGTFSEYTVVPIASVVKVDKAIPLDKAALVGCGVTTGYGAAVRTGETQDGETVVVMGVGGLGINAVQGSIIAGARYVLALDPIAFKREQATRFGATHVAADVAQAQAILADLTRGEMANVCVVTTDSAEGAYVGQALSLVGKRGRVVMTAIPHPSETVVEMSLFDLTLYEKQVRGCLFGSCSPRTDIFRMLELYQAGRLKLDELVTREYALDDLNQGYEDMHNGRNLRGLVKF